MKNLSFNWRRLLTCGESQRLETRQIDCIVVTDDDTYHAAFYGEQILDFENPERREIWLRAIMEANGQKWQPPSAYYDFEIEVEPTPSHTDPDGKAIADALASLRADM